MKNFKFTLLALLAVFIISCQKEELAIEKNQESITKILNIPENLIIPLPTNKMSSEDVGFNIYNSQINTTNCSPIQSGYYYDIGAFNLLLGQSYNFAGGYITIENGGSLNIKASTFDGSVIYEKTFTSSEKFYWGFSSNSSVLLRATSTGTFSLTPFTLANCDFTTDSDGDGCPDAMDSVISSNLEETIVLHQCDSKVINKETLDCGVMMSDRIDILEIGTYRNHGGFVKEVAHLTETWVAQGLLTLEEKDAIMSCAGTSN